MERMASMLRRYSGAKRTVSAKFHLALVDPRDFLAADRRLHDGIDIRDRRKP